MHAHCDGHVYAYPEDDFLLQDNISNIDSYKF